MHEGILSQSAQKMPLCEDSLQTARETSILCKELQLTCAPGMRQSARSTIPEGQCERRIAQTRRLEYQPFKEEAYLFYIRTQCVPRCKHSPLRL
jgi:hypothetical protein